MTTGYDRSYGLDDTAARVTSIFGLLTPRYHEDRARSNRAERWASRPGGICVDARANSWFFEPGDPPRLLMGAAAQVPRMVSSLSVAGWSSTTPDLRRPITDWNPVYRDALPMATVRCLRRPDGPLSTVRPENIRDGMEDYNTGGCSTSAWRRAQFRKRGRPRRCPTTAGVDSPLPEDPQGPRAPERGARSRARANAAGGAVPECRSGAALAAKRSRSSSAGRTPHRSRRGRRHRSRPLPRTRAGFRTQTGEYLVYRGDLRKALCWHHTGHFPVPPIFLPFTS